MPTYLKYWRSAIAAGTLALGASTAYYFLKYEPAQETINPMSSFELLPQETIGAGYLSLNTKTWEKAREFGTPEAREVVTQQIEQLKTSLVAQSPTEQPLNFDQDIAPWVGSILIANLESSNPGSRRILMVVGIKDRLEAIKFALRLKDDAGPRAKVQSYRGVDIYQFQTNLDLPEKNQFLAVVDHHLMVSEQQATIESAINISKGAPSLLENPQVKSAIQESLTLQNPLALGFITPSMLTKQMSPPLQTSTPVLRPAETKNGNLENNKPDAAVVLSLGLDPQGLRIKNVLKHRPDQNWQFDPLPGQIASQFPANTFALFSGGHLQQTWNLLIQQADSNQQIQFNVDRFRQNFIQSTQLDFERDVLSWMDGEFGIGIMPNNEGLLSQVGVGGAIAIQTSNRPNAEQTLKKLNILAQENGAQVQQQNIGGIPVTQWGIPFQGSLVNYGWVDEQTLLLSLGEAPVRSWAQKSGSSVSETSLYQSLFQSLPGSNQNLFFFNNQAFLATVRSSPTISPTLQSAPQFNTVLDSIEGMAMSGSQPDQDTTIGEALISLTKS